MLDLDDHAFLAKAGTFESLFALPADLVEILVGAAWAMMKDAIAFDSGGLANADPFFPG